MGKILIVEFADNEETLFYQTVDWLSSNPSSMPAFIRQQETGFQIAQYILTVWGVGYKFNEEKP